MSEKLISFIIPVYNAEHFIKELVNELHQVENCEIICINDGSKDNSEIILNQLKNDIPNLIVFHQKNQGVSAARNKGIEVAKGKYLSFIDADDNVDIGNLKKVINCLNDSDLVFFGISDCFIYSNDKIQMIYGYKDNKTIDAHEFIKTLGYYLNQMIIYSPCNKLYKRQMILDNQTRFDKNFALGEDALFNVAYFKNMKTVQFTPYDVYIYNHYYNRKDTGSTKYEPNEMEIAIYVYEQILALVKLCHADTSDNLGYIHQFMVRRMSTLLNGAHCTGSSLSEKQKYQFTKKIYNQQIFVEAIWDKQVHMVGKKEKLIHFLLRHKLKVFIYIIYKINYILKSR